MSAVKAIQLAAEQGQPIYTITNKNKAEVLPKLNHRSDVMADVTNALNAGHAVTISQSQINFKGWTGSGYIIIDPNNGSGAYLISGGANGAMTQENAAYSSGLIAGLTISGLLIAGDLISLLIKGPFTPFVALFIIMPFLLGNLIGTMISALTFNWSDKSGNCYLTGLITGLAISGIFGFLFAGKISATLSALGVYLTT